MLIGSGAFGKVYRIEKDGVNYAVKVYNAHLGRGLPDDALKDIFLYSTLGDLQVHDLYLEQGRLHLIMKYHPPVSKPNRIELKLLMYDVLLMLERLHQHSIVHRDIKPDNILHNKLVDFGISLIMSPPDPTREVYTSWYRPPECRQAPYLYDGKADIFALGLTIVQLVLGQPLVKTADCLTRLFDQLQRICTRRILNLSAFGHTLFSVKRYDPVLFSLLTHMLVQAPEQRYSARECLDHAWFSGLKHQLRPAALRICNVEITEEQRNQVRALMIELYPQIKEQPSAVVDNASYLHQITTAPLKTCLIVSLKLLFDGYWTLRNKPNSNAQTELKLVKMMLQDKLSLIIPPEPLPRMAP